MGKVKAKIEAGFAVRGQGYRTGVWILVWQSVDWTLLGAPVDKEGGGYDGGKEETSIQLEVCSAGEMGGGGAYILAAIKPHWRGLTGFPD